MKILVVCSTTKGKVNSFIEEQVDAIRNRGINVDYFHIREKGLLGYWKYLQKLNALLQRKKYDCIHAHYGLSGLLAVLQRKVPVVITFHGSDVNKSSVRPFSVIASKLSSFNIVVEKSQLKRLGLKSKAVVIPCGVDFSKFYQIDKRLAKEKLGLAQSQKYVLFSSSFTNKVKNYPLAKKAVEISGGISLLELKNKTREQVCLLMNAADALLLTSFSEGSPQVIKEALACRLPVIATNVGDVSNLLTYTSNNKITDHNAEEIANALEDVLKKDSRSEEVKDLSIFDNNTIAEKLINIYTTLKKVKVEGFYI